MESNLNLKGFIIGATGAVGRELVQELIKSNNWSKVTIVVRRQLEEWNDFTDEEKTKLEIIQKENLDCLEDISQWKLNDYSSVFCCLGSRIKTGKENFLKVESTYPLLEAKLALHYNVPHYSFVSAMGADPKSWFMLFKTKGETENDLKKIGLPHLSIHRPGQITKRRNDSRFFEDLLSFIPFTPKITAADLSKALRVEAELHHKNPQKQKIITYSHSDMNHLFKTGTYPSNINGE